MDAAIQYKELDVAMDVLVLYSSRVTCKWFGTLRNHFYRAKIPVQFVNHRSHYAGKILDLLQLYTTPQTYGSHRCEMLIPLFLGRKHCTCEKCAKFCSLTFEVWGFTPVFAVL